MKYIIPLTPLGDQATQTSTARLAGLQHGIDSCTIDQHLVPAGGALDLAVSDQERLILLVKGGCSVTAGDATGAFEGNASFFVPAGLACRLVAVQSGSACFVEIQAAGGSNGQAQPVLRDFTQAVFAKHVGHVAARQEQMDTTPLINRAGGSSSIRSFAANVDSGTAMQLHIHPFDQFYLVLEGTLCLQIGLTQCAAKAGELVIFPAGVVHRSWNDSGSLVREVTINVPEQEAGVKGAIEIVLKDVG